jgi:nicotinate-nucleotide adenylyltransferase
MTSAEKPLKTLGIFGGAFDPVHFGHLRSVIELQEALGLTDVLLIPSGNPPHRSSHYATAQQRLVMLNAAVSDLPWCQIDARELDRASPSWSILTLEELRAEYPHRSLCMIVGMDAFLGLPDWHRSSELFELAHVIVAHRPGSALPTSGAVAELLKERRARSADVLTERDAGTILLQEVTQLDISSTAIRKLIAAGGESRHLLPDSVLEIIGQQGCYQKIN